MSSFKDHRFLSISLICIVVHGCCDSLISYFALSLMYCVQFIAVWFVLVVPLHRGIAQINLLAQQASTNATWW